MNTIMLKTPKPLMDSVLKIHEEVSELINNLIADVEFKYHVYQLALIISVTYILSFLFNLRVGFHQVILIALFSSIMAAIYVIFRRMASDIRRISELGISSAFSILLRILILYMTVLPMLSIADEFFRRGIIITFSNPLSFISVILLSVGMVVGSDKLISKLRSAIKPVE